MVIITIIITNFKHDKSYKSWILNVEIHLDAMDIGIPLKKEIKHLSN